MRVLFLLIWLVPFCLEAQTLPVQKDSVPSVEYIFIEGDSIPKTAIDLDEVYIFGRLKFANREERLRYYILRRKTLKVYPYARLASERLVKLNERLDKMTSRSQKRKYTRRMHRYMEGEFSEELKKLTRTEGQILVKLIHRQTGKTTFGLIKELRNGWRAFWYNTTAKAFKISLKEEYHPESVQEDYLIEDILQRAFASGRLEKQNSALSFNYPDLTNKWANKEVRKN